MDDKKPEASDVQERMLAEVKDISKRGLDHPNAKPALIGIAIGAIGGAALLDDGLGLLVGAVVGGLVAIYLQIKK
jgi:hypothetical protein